MQADIENLRLVLSDNSQNISRLLVSFQGQELFISNLSSDFKSRCSIYDSFEIDIKNLDEKYRLGLGKVKMDFDDVLAAAMMNLKDEIDNRLQSLVAQVKQQEDSISDVIETVGQQNSAQEKVIKEMRDAMSALRSSL